VKLQSASLEHASSGVARTVGRASAVGTTEGAADGATDGAGLADGSSGVDDAAATGALSAGEVTFGPWP
jgi:hypothetical protein